MGAGKDRVTFSIREPLIVAVIRSPRACPSINDLFFKLVNNRDTHEVERLYRDRLLDPTQSMGRDQTNKAILLHVILR